VKARQLFSLLKSRIAFAAQTAAPNGFED